MSILADLSRAEVFRGLPRDGLAKLARHGQECSFSPGAKLVTQGEISESMFVIVRGRVRVERWEGPTALPVMLAELGPGEIVGEMGLLDREPRSATVQAIENTDTVELSAAALAVTMLEFPEVTAALLHTLSRRLRNTNELAEQIVLRGWN